MAEIIKDPTKVLAVKRYMTNSEKNREFLKRGAAGPDENFFGVRVIDCPKNVVVERKLSKEVELLEKQKKVLVSRINSSQHIMKLNFRKFRRSSDCLPGDKGENEWPQPGFAFHRDGTRKSSTDMNIHNSIHQLKKDIESIHHSADHKHSSDHVLKANPSEISDMITDDETRNEYEREMKAIEKSVKQLSEEARNVKYKMIEASGKARKYPYLRAHQNDYVWHLPSGSVRFLKDQKQPGLIMENAGSGFRQHDPGYLAFDRRGHLHKATYHTKPQCAACEFRVKGKQNVKQDKRKAPTLDDGIHHHKFLVGNVNSQSTLFRLSSGILKDRELEHHQMTAGYFGSGQPSPSSSRGRQQQSPPESKDGDKLSGTSASSKRGAERENVSSSKEPTPPKGPKSYKRGKDIRRASDIVAISEVRDLPNDAGNGITRRQSLNIPKKTAQTSPSLTHSNQENPLTLPVEDFRRSKTAFSRFLEDDDLKRKRSLSARNLLLKRAELESKSSQIKINQFLEKIKPADEKPPTRPAGCAPTAVVRKKTPATPLFTRVIQPRGIFTPPSRIDTEKDPVQLMRELRKCRYLREYKPRKVYWH